MSQIWDKLKEVPLRWLFLALILSGFGLAALAREGLRFRPREAGG